MSRKFVLHQLALAAMLLQMWAAEAQTVDAGAVQRGIEETNLPPKPVTPVDKPTVQDRKLADRLVEVQVEGTVLREQVQAYWQQGVGKPVGLQQLLAFESWLSEQGRRAGFLAYAQSELESLPGGGHRLKVRVVAPRVAKVSVSLAQAPLGQEYQERIEARIRRVVQLGELLNVQQLDEYLPAVTLDLPVDVAVVLKPNGPEQLDLMLEVGPRAARPGSVEVSAWQINNHGLTQYGHPQFLGSISQVGVRPGDQFNLLGLGSQGVAFLRAEYDAAVPALYGRLRTWASKSFTRTIKGGAAAVSGSAQENGVGYAHLLPVASAHPVKSQYSLSRRTTDSRLTGTEFEISDIADSQFRWTLSTETFPSAYQNWRAEMTLAAGDYTWVRGDVTPEGGYRFLQVAGRYGRALSEDSRWRAELRLRAQWASRNLDSYNRFALGGVSGVRAYTTADGVGDEGAQWSAEVQRQITPTQSVGLFYDGGVVRPNKTAVSGSLSSSYTLNALGVSWNGSYGSWVWQSSLAKGFGGYKKAEANEPTESKANETRLYVSLSYYF
jgi:hemolysin activation/secretion protein